MDDTPQHVVSLGLPSAALISFFAQWSPVLTGVLACAGIVWYLILFYDRWRHGPSR